MFEKAIELGRQVGQSEEYRALRRAQDRIAASDELRGRLDQLRGMAEAIERRVAQGEEPTEADAASYDQLLSQIQTDSAYQAVVVAQAAFDKLMLKVNERIMEGMRKGGTSSIITLS